MYRANIIATVVLLLWPLITIALFRAMRPAPAGCIALIGGALLLPSRIAFDGPGLPPLGRNEISVLSVFVGIISVGGWRRLRSARPGRGLEVLLILMLFAAIGTALTNGDPIQTGLRHLKSLRPIDGLSLWLRDILTFGLPFFLGRALIRTSRDLRDLLIVLAVSALLYSALVAFEIRMAPRLHRYLYGFDPQSWLQIMRSGGFRPVVFMPHGLALALFMASGVGAWATLGKLGIRWRGIPAALPLGWLLLLLVLSKSLAATLYGLLLAGSGLIRDPRWQMRLATLLAALALAYPTLRITELIPLDAVDAGARMVSEQRAQSLRFRFENEEWMLNRVRARPLFGWGAFGRARRYDEMGKDRTVTDGFWIIVLTQRGFITASCALMILVIPVFQTTRRLGRIPSHRDRQLCAGASLILAVHTIDLLPNGLFTVLPLFYSGALAGALPAMAGAPQPRRRTSRARTLAQGTARPGTGTAALRTDAPSHSRDSEPGSPERTTRLNELLTPRPERDS